MVRGQGAGRVASSKCHGLGQAAWLPGRVAQLASDYIHVEVRRARLEPRAETTLVRQRQKGQASAEWPGRPTFGAGSHGNAGFACFQVKNGGFGGPITWFTQESGEDEDEAGWHPLAQWLG